MQSNVTRIIVAAIFVTAILSGTVVTHSSVGFAQETKATEKGNPSDCAKIKDGDKKEECRKKALEEMKEGKNDGNKDKNGNKDKKKK